MLIACLCLSSLANAGGELRIASELFSRQGVKVLEMSDGTTLLTLFTDGLKCYQLPTMVEITDVLGELNEVNMSLAVPIDPAGVFSYDFLEECNRINSIPEMTDIASRMPDLLTPEMIELVSSVPDIATRRAIPYLGSPDFIGHPQSEYIDNQEALTIWFKLRPVIRSLEEEGMATKENLNFDKWQLKREEGYQLYQKIFDKVFSFIEETNKELEQLAHNERSISLVQAEVQIGRTIELQEELRLFAVKYLNHFCSVPDTSQFWKMDVLLSWFRLYYSFVAGNPFPVEDTRLLSTQEAYSQWRNKIQDRYKDNKPLVEEKTEAPRNSNRLQRTLTIMGYYSLPTFNWEPTSKW